MALRIFAFGQSYDCACVHRLKDFDERNQVAASTSAAAAKTKEAVSSGLSKITGTGSSPVVPVHVVDISLIGTDINSLCRFLCSVGTRTLSRDVVEEPL